MAAVEVLPKARLAMLIYTASHPDSLCRCVRTDVPPLPLDVPSMQISPATRKRTT